MLRAEGSAKPSRARRWVLLSHALESCRQWTLAPRGLGGDLTPRLSRTQRADCPYITLDGASPQHLARLRHVSGPPSAYELRQEHQRLQ
eukprot:2027762-Pleurochrysis_carterae.AAC.1